MSVTLRDKFYGCICGSQIGSALGAPVEGWSYKQIEKKYGTLDTLQPYMGYENGWMREPGTTEDGIERQRLMISAIIDKQDRVNAEDIKKVWIRDIKPEGPGMCSERFDGTLLEMAKSGIPARDIGRYCDYSNLVSVARTCHAIGLINAGDIQGAIDDVFEIGQLYQATNGGGIKWAAVTTAAIAAATKLDATVDSVIGAIYDNCEKGSGRSFDESWLHNNIIAEIDRELKRTEHCKDFRELRKAFDESYNGEGMPYALSYANEIVTKAICIFRMVKGNTMEAMVAGANMGRDTDCVTAVAAGISGALTGAASIPEKFIKQTDYATLHNPYTNSQRLLRETSDGLYYAFKTRLKRMRIYADEMDID